MGEHTLIQWTNATVNFWTGCKKVSAGCKFCYMFRDQIKYGNDPELIKRTSDKTFNAALKWKEPKFIFTCSWSDFFIENADAWRADAWDVIRKTPQHTWQILTKRPERIRECLPPDWGDGWPNVWLGVTIEDQKSVERMQVLCEIPAYIRFLSVEPLLEQIDLCIYASSVGDGKISYTNDPKQVRGYCMEVLRMFDWVIIGGESGNNFGDFRFRECHVDWMENVIHQCKQYSSSTKIFVKQMGTFLSQKFKFKNDRHGGNIDNFPTRLRLREMPTIDLHDRARMAKTISLNLPVNEFYTFAHQES